MDIDHQVWSGRRFSEEFSSDEFTDLAWAGSAVNLRLEDPFCSIKRRTSWPRLCTPVFKNTLCNIPLTQLS
ncbi:MAG TPA: hypothetical protein VGH38_14610, partial [Bryobacteraceae bacterium]